MKIVTRLLGAALIAGSLFAGAPAKADVYFRDNDRVVLHDYFTASPSTTTTTKTTVTYYDPGSVLPDTVTYTQLPSTVVTKLNPAPSGDTYVAVGRNAYLIDQNRRVIDAVKIDD